MLTEPQVERRTPSYSPANLSAPAAPVNPLPTPPRVRRPRRVDALPHRPLRSAALGVSYRFLYAVARFIRVQTLHIHTINPEAVRRTGGYILTPTHLSHLEPILLAALNPRKVDWMARVEFYRIWAIRWLLDFTDCFPVNRFGVPVSSIRAAVARARAGRIVGIFPEGGVAQGPDFVCRGGRMKEGACLVSRLSGVPIVPCVVLGTHRLNTPAPWVPFRFFPPRRTHLWVAYGRPIEPRLDEPNVRRARKLQADELRAEYRRLYHQLLEQYGFDDTVAP